MTQKQTAFVKTGFRFKPNLDNTGTLISSSGMISAHKFQVKCDFSYKSTTFSKHLWTEMRIWNLL